LGADEKTLKHYLPITTNDLVVSKDITEENRWGQWNDLMAWFWRVGEHDGRKESDWMQECKSIQIFSFSITN
jgi:hypothetical protein